MLTAAMVLELFLSQVSESLLSWCCILLNATSSLNCTGQYLKPCCLSKKLISKHVYYGCTVQPPSTVSVALALHTSGTFARRSPTSLVGRISVLSNAATCRSVVPEMNLVDGVSKLQHQPFGTLCLSGTPTLDTDQSQTV